MNQEILSEAVQKYLKKICAEQPSSIALRKSPFPQVRASELANQVDGYQRSAKKIPAWLSFPAIYFPEKLNLEQCSSSETGLFKANLIQKDSTLIDLTGGFGVDSFYFAQVAKQVTHCEINTDLSEITAHNFAQMKQHNIACQAMDGLVLLNQNENTYDYIYIDPSRRVKQQKVFLLEDCEPNVVAAQDLFFQKAANILTKVAPLLDITQALRSLRHVKAVYVISVNNDCKELLFLQEKGFVGTPQIHAVRIQHQRQQVFSFSQEQERDSVAVLGLPGKYLYDPDVALTKAGAFKSLATRFDLQKLHTNTHLYTANFLVSDFPGRCFEIIAVTPYAAFKKCKKGEKANVSTKNFPLKVEELRKKFNIKDGGERYLFFTCNKQQELLVIDCLKTL